VGISPAAAQALQEGAEGSVMTNPSWILVPWAVFALAAGIKFWRLTSAWRQRGMNSKDTDQFRRSLERSWQKDQQAA